MKNEENIIVAVKGLSRIKQEVELFSCPGILAVCRISHQDGERHHTYGHHLPLFVSYLVIFESRN
jgi:hypothetical protein